MAMYVVRATVIDAFPSPVVHRGAVAVARATEPLDPDPGPGPEVIDLVGSPSLQRLRDRLQSWRTVWSQTTFYVFDPESWR